MGIRIHSAVVYGVHFTKKEINSFQKFMRDKPTDWFLMRYVEKRLLIGKAKKYTPENKSRYEDYLLCIKFLRRNKDGIVLKPYKPFWSKVTEKEVGSNIFEAAQDYLKKCNSNSEATTFDNRRIWWPEDGNDGHAAGIFGYVQEERSCSEIDYALLDILDIRQNKNFVISGSRPWECGTEYLKEEKLWNTCNGQHMISERYLPKDISIEEREDIHRTICTQYGGTRKKFIEKKKAIWDKYHGELRPYKVYPGEGWHGSDFYFYPVDSLFQTICEYIPEIKYDIMRLEKFLCYYWC